MRAKIALALAALTTISLFGSVQRASASDLSCDVARILQPGHRGLFGARRAAVNNYVVNGITQPAVVAGTGCGAAVIPAPAAVAAPGPAAIVVGVTGTPLISGQPTVLAGTACGGTALLTPGPSDLDERREGLKKRICEAASISLIAPGDAAYLGNALALVGQAEGNWLARGPINVDESRRLYRAMDRVDRELHWMTAPRRTFLGGLVPLNY